MSLPQVTEFLKTTGNRKKNLENCSICFLPISKDCRSIDIINFSWLLFISQYPSNSSRSAAINISKIRKMPKSNFINSPNPIKKNFFFNVRVLYLQPENMYECTIKYYREREKKTDFVWCCLTVLFGDRVFPTHHTNSYPNILMTFFTDRLSHLI